MRFFMLQIFYDAFSNYSFLAVFFLSMVPTLESKVSIPFGLSKAIWGSKALSFFSACFWACLGCFLPALVVFCLVKTLKKKTCGIWTKKLFSKYEDKIHDKVSDLKKCFLLSSFVALPLPLTGVYSGAIIAALTNLKFWKVFLSLLIGEICSCLIVVLFSVIFKDSCIVLFVSLGLVFVFFIFELVRYFIKLQKQKREIEIK